MGFDDASRARGRVLAVLCLSVCWISAGSAAGGNVYKEYGGILGIDGAAHAEWSDFPRTPLFPVLPLVVSQIAASGGDELCRSQSEAFLRELRNFTLWAVQMFDASTKFPDGIVNGNSYHMGNFDQCVSVSVDLSSDTMDSSTPRENMLSGQYCLAEISFVNEWEEQQVRNYTLDPYALTYNPKQTAWNRIRYLGDPTKSRRDVLHWALCIPASCSPSAVEDALVQATNWIQETYGKGLKIKASIPDRMCQTNRSGEFLSVYDIIFGAISTALAIIVIGATVYDISSEDTIGENASSKTGFVRQIVLCFSGRRNFRNIFRTKPSENSMDCVHGTRLLSMLLIIMGHRIKSIISGPVFNPEVIEQGYRRPAGSFLINGLIIVDTFFLYGGLLTTYFLLLELDKRKNLNFLKLCILRFLRLTPVYMMVVLFHATLFHKIGSGPLWESKIGLERDRCVSSWWTNLLYINNYVKDDEMCMFQSWYMSCDMQFFFLSLFIVYFLWKKPRIGFVMLGMATFLSLIIPFLIIYIEEKEAILLPYISNLKDVQSNENFISFYTKSHNRAGPYVVGIITGYMLYKFHNSKFKLNKMQSQIAFISCLTLAVVTLISGFLFYYPGNRYNALESAFYGSCFRVSWAASIGFGLFVFIKGDLGFMQRALQWKAFIPLSRLTYCAYLVHTMVQLYHIGTLRKPEYGTVPLALWQTTGDIFVTFLVSLILCLTIEAPTRAIEKVLFRRNCILNIEDAAKTCGVAYDIFMKQLSYMYVPYFIHEDIQFMKTSKCHALDTSASFFSLCPMVHFV